MTGIGQAQMRRRKLNYRKFRNRFGAVTLVVALLIAAIIYNNNNILAGVISKPKVLVIDLNYNSTTGVQSSGEYMWDYLKNTAGYAFTDIYDARTTLPSHADANNYDVIIFSTGNATVTTINNSGALTWIYDQLYGTGNNHRMILEGDSFVNAINGGTYQSTILHATATGSRVTNSSYTFNVISGASHYVIKGTGTGVDISAINPTYTNNTTNGIRPYTSDSANGGVPLYKYTNTTTQPYDILSVWKSTDGASREVIMAFTWDNNNTYGIRGTGNNQTWREGLLKNAVDWTGKFLEASYSSANQPSAVNPGTNGVYMGRISLTNSIGDAASNVTGLKVQRTGSSTDASVSAVKLYGDTNGNGTFEPGTDTLLQTASLSGGVATFSGLNIPVNTATGYLFITYDVPAGANQKTTIQATIDPTTITSNDNCLIKTANILQSNTVYINDITPPLAPSGVKATALSATSLRVSWNANSESDLVGYQVYRDSSATGSFTDRIATVTGATYFDNTGLTEWTQYYYKVLAYDNAPTPNLSALSTPAVLGIPNAPPVAPTGLNVANPTPAPGRTLVITWNANTDADLAGYNLYVASADTGPYAKVNSSIIVKTDTPSYTHTGLTDNTTYYYKVSAVDTYGAESPLSAYNSGIPIDTTPPQIVSQYPAAGQDLVPRNAVIKVKIDDPIDPASVKSSTIQVIDQNNQTIPGTVYFDSINNEVQFKITDVEPYLGRYPSAGSFTVTLIGTAPNGIKNKSGLYLIDGSAGTDQVWTFGTLINPHANFKTNTTLCGYCHLAHAATGNNLIRQSKILGLCLLCHDGTGSSYDVKAGIYFNGDNAVPLLSGGYDIAMGSTSTHFSDLTSFVYGGSLEPMTVDCNNCHEPHGTTNYRNLRTVVNGVPVTVTGEVYGPAYSVKTASGREVATYVYGIDQFCGVCHMDYLVYNGPNTSDGKINWRHRVGIGMTGGSSGGDFVISYPEPGLSTTLPTEGTSTGAHIQNYEILPAQVGGLPPQTYNYIVTGVNGVGESVYGNVLQVTTVADNQSVKISWEPIANAYKYRVYRYVGSLDVTNFDVNQFQYLWEVDDYPTSFTDDGNYSPTNVHPPTSSNAKIMCLTCHYSHGTTAVAEEPTRLRRLDYNGVCEDCHKK